MNTLTIDLGQRIGLIGDVHGNLPFLIEALFQLEKQDATSLVQLGDFGLFWSGATHEREAIAAVNAVLEAMDRELLVVLGNHENYTLIDAINAEPDGSRRLGRVVLLPRSGTLTAAGRPAGFLAGAGSVDRYYRKPRRSWWRQEIPTAEEANGLTGAANTLDIVFAHDALRGPSLQSRLLANRGLWNENDLAYAENASDLFTKRVLPVLSDGGLVVSGHYHFRHSADEVMDRADGTLLRARSEVLSCEWEDDAVGILDARTLAVQTMTLDPVLARDTYNALSNRPAYWVI